MAHACPVCIHDSRPAIEQAILSGKPMFAIARNFGFTYVARKTGKATPDPKSLTRHRDTHMGVLYQKAMAHRESQSGDLIAQRLEVLDAEVDRVIERANAGEPVVVGDVPLLNEDGTPMVRRDNRLLLNAVREGRANLELRAKLAGRTETSPEELESVRAHLQTPKGRALLAELDALAAQADAGQPRRT